MIKETKEIKKLVEDQEFAEINLSELPFLISQMNKEQKQQFILERIQ